jgi:predicted unusual protein kinase regulating ubiquinone biosynthesis (AarF/ABC1/UbiB family)
LSDDPDFKPATGRLSRFARLAGLGARLSTEVMSKGVKRLAGSTEGLLGNAGAEKLVATLGEMKGLAMKLGQAMSMDPDQLPPEVRAVIARLQNQAPAMPFATVREVVRRELGGTPEEKFAQFDPTPLASASLGQVHRARTHAGKEVAVKVQYPDIRKAMLSDLANLGPMVSVVSRGVGMSEGRAYFEEVRDELMKELDYREEAARAKQYAKAAAVAADLVVPAPDDSLTSERLLTLELIHGETLKDVLGRIDEVPTLERFRISRLLIRAIWAPFLSSGLIHADPHPGNFIVMNDGRMAVLDFGSVKQLSPAWLDVNRRMFRWILDDAPMDVVKLSREAGFTITVKDAECGPFIRGTVDIACQPVRGRDFDFATADTTRLMRNHFLKHAFKIPQMRPPTEGLMFYRALGGLIQDLQNLKARGDFRSVYEELATLW